MAAAFLTVSALLTGTLGTEQISNTPATVSALRQLSFFVGGAGHTVWLGVLVGSASLAAQRTRTLSRRLTAAGLVSATLSILSLLSLVVNPAALFIPLGRFSGLLVIATASVLMATGRIGQVHGASSIRAPLIGGVLVVVLAFLLTVTL